jgi:AAA domain-containing protein
MSDMEASLAALKSTYDEIAAAEAGKKPRKVIPFQETRGPHIELVPFDEIQLGTQRRYLVKGLIPRVGIIVVWGPPKSGKSFWTFDLNLRVALGWEYRGRRVHQGAVVYCAFEGQTGIQARVEAFRQRFLAEDHATIPFYLQPVTLDLVRDHVELVEAIRAKLGDTRPVCITLDTLNRSLRGSESNDEYMTAYIRAADAIREAFECAIIIVHHCGIEGTRPRGHTSLTGAADAQLSVKRGAGENIIVELECAKDGPQGERIASRLEVVEVGTDEDGETIDSCVVIPVDAADIANVPARKLSNKNQLAIECLADVLADRGQPATDALGPPPGVLTIGVAAWRDELKRRGVLDAEGANPRADFKRIREALQARHLIGERDGLVWLAKG